MPLDRRRSHKGDVCLLLFLQNPNAVIIQCSTSREYIASGRNIISICLAILTYSRAIHTRVLEMERQNGLKNTTQACSVSHAVNTVTHFSLNGRNSKAISGQWINAEIEICCFSLYKYWGKCFYHEVSTKCSVPAADYVMMYLVDGWQPVLSHRYGCDLGKLYRNFSHSQQVSQSCQDPCG